jgi:hypothetical protein
VRKRTLVPIMEYARRIASLRFEAGFGFEEVHVAFNNLEEVMWRAIVARGDEAELADALALVSSVLGAGKQALATQWGHPCKPRQGDTVARRIRLVRWDWHSREHLGSRPSVKWCRKLAHRAFTSFGLARASHRATRRARFMSEPRELWPASLASVISADDIGARRHSAQGQASGQGCSESESRPRSPVRIMVPIV